jgi:hypothetical protein
LENKLFKKKNPKKEEETNGEKYKTKTNKRKKRKVRRIIEWVGK